MSKKSSNAWLITVAIVAFLGMIMIPVAAVVKSNIEDKEGSSENQETDANDDGGTDGAGADADTSDNVDTEILKIDFQPVVDEWAKSTGGNKSVLIYDLNLNETVGSYNVQEDYNTASLYKLFVVYEGYKRVEAGLWNPNDRAGSTGYTISKCLDLAIRESNSDCAEVMWGLIGRDALDIIIETEWGITDSDISRLISNVSDISKIMKRFYEHPDFNGPSFLETMWDSFLVQPTTIYNWRQGLPSGFSKASVYNKVGWDFNPDGNYWNIYHDAAIVKFPLEDGTTRDYIVVVMSNRLDFKYIKKLGTALENYFYS